MPLLLYAHLLVQGQRFQQGQFQQELEIMFVTVRLNQKEDDEER
jgi:hypothetical protein